MSYMSVLMRFNGMRDIGALEVDPKLLSNGERNANPLGCPRKDALVFDGLNRLLSKVLGVIGGVALLVYGKGNPLVHLEEMFVSAPTHNQTTKTYYLSSMAS